MPIGSGRTRRTPGPPRCARWRHRPPRPPALFTFLAKSEILTVAPARRRRRRRRRRSVPAPSRDGTGTRRRAKWKRSINGWPQKTDGGVQLALHQRDPADRPVPRHAVPRPVRVAGRRGGHYRQRRGDPASPAGQQIPLRWSKSSEQGGHDVHRQRPARPSDCRAGQTWVALVARRCGGQRRESRGRSRQQPHLGLRSVSDRVTGTERVKRGLAEMLRGGVIMDVVDRRAGQDRRGRRCGSGDGARAGAGRHPSRRRRRPHERSRV